MGGRRLAVRALAQQTEEVKQIAAARPAARGRVDARGSRTEDKILWLQRTLGNRAVEGLLREKPEAVPEDPSVTMGVAEAKPAAMDGVPLPPCVRATMEASFGAALDDVRVHAGPGAQRSARALGARAFTTGSNIVLGDQVSPSEVHDPRSRLLAHELTHVLHHRRAGNRGATDRIVPGGSAAEREAGRSSLLHGHGLPVGTVRLASEAVALTPTSDAVEYDLSYAANDWTVTAAEEKRILDALDRDANLSATI